MAIDDLSDQILLLIVENLSPDDIEAFSSTGRRIRTLSSARLIHHRTLKSEYSAVVLADGVEGGITHPIRLLYEIWKDHVVAQYVKYITFVCEDRYSVRDFAFDASRVEDGTLDIIRRLNGAESLLRESPYFSRHEDHLQTCLEGMLARRESAAFALLLVSLPNLRRLRFSTPEWDKTLLSTIFMSKTAPDPTPGVLSKLSVVECYHSDTEGGTPVGALAIFALAPSVRMLKGITINGNAEMFSTIPGWHTAVSHLECLELTAGAIEKETLKPLFLPMRGLREFRYCHNCNSLGGETFDIHAWVDSLAGSVGRTLEILSLTNPDGATTTVKSFKGFLRLRELELEVQSLVPDEDEDMSLNSEADNLSQGFHQPDEREIEELVPRLVDILPLSVEAITLLIGGHEEETGLLLRDLALEKDQCLPRLAKFTYGGRNLDQSVKNELKSAGVAIGRKKEAFAPKHVKIWREDLPLSWA